MIDNSWYRTALLRESIARDVASIEQNGDTFYEDVTSYDASKTVLFSATLPTVKVKLGRSMRKRCTILKHLIAIL